MRTRVGYAGGTLENPTYYHLGDHTETIQIDYDPARISYQELLDIFWNSHSPTAPSWSRQYMSIIFYHDEEQQRLAEASKAQVEARWGKTVYTEIVPYTRFYLAEDYHQKYYLRNRVEFLQQYLSIYPVLDDFVNSTAVTRVNGYLGRNGDVDLLEKELDDLGLTPELRDRLWRLVAGPNRALKRDKNPPCETGACG